MRRLLILGCTKTKYQTSRLPLTAIERYNGTSFRMLRFHLSCSHVWNEVHPYRARTLDVLIISAKHGLLLPDTYIESYDQVMTLAQADALRSNIRHDLAQLIQNRSPYQATLIHLGYNYLCTLTARPENRIATQLHIEVARTSLVELVGDSFGQMTFITGGIGTRLGQLKHWLNAPRTSSVAPPNALESCESL